MPRFARSALTLSGLLALGCTDRPAPTETPASSAPALNFTNGPSAPGPVVLRGQTGDFIFLVPDLRENLTASIGLVEPFSVWCDPTQPVTIAPVDVQELEKPNGSLGALYQGTDLPVIVYGVGTVDFCPDLVGAPIVATGTARFVFNDRDSDDPPSYGYRATGTLNLTAGGTAHFTGIVKWVTTGSGEVRVHSNVTLTRGR